LAFIDCDRCNGVFQQRNRRCDCLIIYDEQDEIEIFAVELKSGRPDIAHAINQL
jgi:hypothetical protein